MLRGQFFESMYVSEFAADAYPGEIADIVRVARATNALTGLTGVLLFDGNLFCQQLEGPETTVGHTIAKIAVDHRHTRFQALHEGPISKKRIVDAWHAGILAPDGPSPLTALRSLRGNAAVEHLLLVYHRSGEYGLDIIWWSCTFAGDCGLYCYQVTWLSQMLWRRCASLCALTYRRTGPHGLLSESYMSGTALPSINPLRSLRRRAT